MRESEMASSRDKEMRAALERRIPDPRHVSQRPVSEEGNGQAAKAAALNYRANADRISQVRERDLERQLVGRR